MTLVDALTLCGAPQSPRLAVRGVVAGARAYLLARLFIEQRQSLLVVTPDALRRDQLYDDLRCFLAGIHPFMAHERDTPEYVQRYIYDASGAPEGCRAPRQRALYTSQPLWRLQRAAPVIVVAAVQALTYKVPAPSLLLRQSMHIRPGAFYALETLVQTLNDYGYQRVPVVEEVGELSLRGGILDLFAPGQSHPWRIEFFGDEIDTIRTFDVTSQLSLATCSEALVPPMHPLSPHCLQRPTAVARLQQHLQAHGYTAERSAALLDTLRQQHPVAWSPGLDTFFYEALDSPLAYVSENGLLCCVALEDTLAALRQDAEPVGNGLGETAVPVPQEYRIAPPEVARQLQERLQVTFVQYEHPTADETVKVLQTRGVPQFFGVLEHFVASLRQWQAEGYRTCIVCRFPLEVRRLQDLLATYDIGSRTVSALAACLVDEGSEPGAVLLGVGELSQGFVLPASSLVVVRAADILGEKKPAGPAVSRRSAASRQPDGLQPGELVVHVDHGIGRYRGMTYLTVGQDRGEFMELEYADGAKLYVPSYRASVMQKYAGGEASSAPLNRLGGSQWLRTKARIKASLLAMAEDLVRVHAARQARPGYSFSTPTTLHREFEHSFAYEETEDQLRAIEQVIEDMERPQAMERLVCGDVGYGKTEVAMRAAFKAVYDGKQAAVLVPTTVLAQQHYMTFRQRFASHAVEIGVLSRMRSRKEQQQVLAGLLRGSVDIVIGTHRLLQKDVRFKALGLLVVDEEHRFGVAHKERIKRMSVDVDVLMLTATPIPRSLHMALVGLRQFSLIETPPEGRSAIQTMVTPFSEETVRHAIRQELMRDGQVFFVHNHIDTLPAMQDMLRRLVPECRIAVAHGQMAERTLESIMLRFLERQFDVLLCTTIIESGLDIPSVNTIIINRAERFGLAQLYQLRGRVGRRAQQAYAYLLVPGDLVLSTTARKRIEAIEEFSALGSGFQLASRDLEIRGAGNLLGPQQSGHIASVGFHLYCSMLDEAIRTVRGDTQAVRVDPELRLEIQGYIPRDYIASDAQRLEIYQRLAAVESETALEAIVQELQDRFGPVPEVTRRLLTVVEVKLLSRRLALERLEQRAEETVLTFHQQTPMVPEAVLGWLRTLKTAYQFDSERVIRLRLSEPTPEARVSWLTKHLPGLLRSGSI